MLKLCQGQSLNKLMTNALRVPFFPLFKSTMQSHLLLCKLCRLSDSSTGQFTHLTRFPIRDSRYLRAESCPRSLLYPLVNRPSACLVGLQSITQQIALKSDYIWCIQTPNGTTTHGRTKTRNSSDSRDELIIMMIIVQSGQRMHSSVETVVVWWCNREAATVQSVYLSSKSTHMR